MRKKDVLIILSGVQVSKTIKKGSDVVTRMPETVPEQYQDLLIRQCRKRARQIQNALERLEKSRGSSP